MHCYNLNEIMCYSNLIDYVMCMNMI